MGTIVYRGPSLLPGGAPIVGVLTGLRKPSANAKTGPMAQLWILAESENPIAAQRTGHDSAICGDCPMRPSALKRTNGYVDADEAVRMGWRTFRVSDGEAPLRREIICPASAEAGHRTTCERCQLCDGARPEDRRKLVVIKRHGPANMEDRCYVQVLHAPLSIWRSLGGMPEMGADDWRRLGQRSIRLGAYGDPAALPFDLVRGLAMGAMGWTGYTHAWRYCDQRFRELLMASC